MLARPADCGGSCGRAHYRRPEAESIPTTDLRHASGLDRLCFHPCCRVEVGKERAAVTTFVVPVHSVIVKVTWTADDWSCVGPTGGR